MIRTLSGSGLTTFLERCRVVWVYLISLAYILLNAYLIYKNYYYSLAIPLLLVLIYFYFTRLDWVLFLIAFCTPIAVNMVQYELGAGLSIPTEPLLFGVLLIFILKLFYKNDFDRKIWTHPVSIVVLVCLIWMFITSFTSQIPLVSFKYLLARLWFVIPFYFLGILLFRKTQNIRLFIWLYAIPLMGVIIYTISVHSTYGFDEEAGHWVMSPFYNDHTAYGAILALFLPVFAGFSFSRIFSRTTRFFSIIIMLILIIALFFSFCRAAWISLAVTFLIYLVILFRIKFKWIIVILGSLVIFFFMFQQQIWDVAERNKQGTSGNFIEHVQSISNISTDDSNLERINRWQSALRMFDERPFFGFGPGTYQFEYAPYQLSKEKTLISTNAGDRGNAHSEFIGPLAEQGILGMLLMITFVIMIIVYGLKVHRQAKTPEIRLLSLTLLLGLITYFLHGTLNNFLDTDKASIPVWAFIAMLVAMDMYQNRGLPPQK
ncbi:MAG: O-antigen ligase family protein [Bacteroidetes bacterium]|nr:MAG: O-antigen ligase family protein [Bacteroidota bacterium]